MQDDRAGLKRKLASRLDPPNKSMKTSWEVGEQLAAWFRPQYDARVYPYCPPHITRAREVRKVRANVNNPRKNWAMDEWTSMEGHSLTHLLTD